MDKTLETLDTIDCACVIHGDAYPWIYVERLYNMLTKHLSKPIRFHVYTESERTVPSHMIKHALPNWGIHGPRLGWWYKIKLFDSAEHSGPLLYFDLDTIIVNNIDWICNSSLNWFWAVRDFKYLWRPEHYSVNSSIMWWDTRRYGYIWTEFQKQNLQKTIKTYRGDQDFISRTASNKDTRFFDTNRIKSWRWECFSEGYKMKPSKANKHTTDPVILPGTSVLVFHGQPEPHNLQNSIIAQHWQ